MAGWKTSVATEREEKLAPQAFEQGWGLSADSLDLGVPEAAGRDRTRKLTA